MKTNIDKNKLNNNDIKRFLNKEFNQLQKSKINNNEISIEEQLNLLFSLYDKYFFNIPKTGVNSHSTLIDKSVNYIGEQTDNDLVNALLLEINDLKEQNNILNKTLQDILTQL